jgi:hypothetical protein
MDPYISRDISNKYAPIEEWGEVQVSERNEKKIYLFLNLKFIWSMRMQSCESLRDSQTNFQIRI